MSGIAAINSGGSQDYSLQSSNSTQNSQQSTAEDFFAVMQNQVQDWMGSKDTDGSKNLTASELGMNSTQFNAIDYNQDGVFDATEAEQALLDSHAREVENLDKAEGQSASGQQSAQQSGIGQSDSSSDYNTAASYFGVDMNANPSAFKEFLAMQQAGQGSLSMLQSGLAAASAIV